MSPSPSRRTSPIGCSPIHPFAAINASDERDLHLLLISDGCRWYCRATKPFVIGQPAVSSSEPSFPCCDDGSDSHSHELTYACILRPPPHPPTCSWTFRPVFHLSFWALTTEKWTRNVGPTNDDMSVCQCLHVSTVLSLVLASRQKYQHQPNPINPV